MNRQINPARGWGLALLCVLAAQPLAFVGIMLGLAPVWRFLAIRYAGVELPFQLLCAALLYLSWLSAQAAWVLRKGRAGAMQKAVQLLVLEYVFGALLPLLFLLPDFPNGFWARQWAMRIECFDLLNVTPLLWAVWLKRAEKGGGMAAVMGMPNLTVASRDISGEKIKEKIEEKSEEPA